MRLKTTDGRKLTLIRVLHVPTLGKNLISLGTLDRFEFGTKRH